MSYQARCYIRRVLSALALAIVIFVIRREWHLTGFSNAMAISGSDDKFQMESFLQEF